MKNEPSPTDPHPPVEHADWKQVVLRYQQPSTWRASIQILNTLLPYAVLWYLMYLCLSISLWLVVPLAMLAGMFLIRVFIIFHDCGHGSFFKSRLANDTVGFISGLLTFTPYYHWRWSHAIHHSTAGQLDKRGTGDVWTMTVEEYINSTRWKKFSYRVARNPLVLFIIAPLLLFTVGQRFPSPQANPRERRSVHIMNLAILGMAIVLSWIYGVGPYLLIQGIILMVAGGAGVWLFYVQHQFEDVYWERGENWSFVSAALEGSSFYKLPRILQWFSGNIGYHHIHHLSSRIPNYNLEECHEAEPLFQSVKPITFLSSLKSLAFRLWDEKNKRLIGFRQLKKIRHPSEKPSQARH